MGAHAGGHLDERFGDRGAFHADRSAGRERQYHQQGGEELRRRRGVDFEAAQLSGRVQGEREAACGRTIGLECAAAAGGQRVEQAAHRAGAHGFVAIELIAASRGERQEGGEEAGGRAGVADMNLGAGVRDTTAQAGDADRAGGFVGRDHEAEGLQRGDEDAGVSAEQRAGEERLAVGERG